ncbi:MAG: AAA family ATPase [Phycisphaerales bacterium]|nr:MAG: AAA family ATPase [Phycisphaerales bacterium]
MIKFQCKKCGQEINVQNESSSKRGKCPKCGSVVTVPGEPADRPNAGSESRSDTRLLLDRDPAAVLEGLPEKVERLRSEVGKVVFGQSTAIDGILYALLSRGHCLLVGVPGLAKTLLVRCMARVMELKFARIQFTPDLMPGDITGTEILQVDRASDQRRLIFAPGPIFTQMLLADEINRTPPKTQAALLEAMQEETVTVGENTHRLAAPFVVLATQNPIEQEGTYPLPEAQLDRFMVELIVDYPSREDENRVVAEHSFTPLEKLRPVLTGDEILQFRQAVAQVPAAPNVVDYAVRLARATRPGDELAPEYVEEYIHWGASPRAAQHLILAGRARAACEGRFNVAREDIEAVALPVLRHRLIRTFRAETKGKTTDDIISELLTDMPS